MENDTRQSSLWAGGLITVSLIILQVFISSGISDIASFISVCAFALAIPILACNILINFTRGKKRKDGKKPKASIYEISFFLLGIVASLIGIASAFWYICWIASLIFSASTLLALLVYFRLVQKTSQ